MILSVPLRLAGGRRMMRERTAVPIMPVAASSCVKTTVGSVPRRTAWAMVRKTELMYYVRHFLRDTASEFYVKEG